MAYKSKAMSSKAAPAKRKTSAKQREALAKGRKKGMALMERAVEIQKEAGQRTVTKKVYNMPMNKALEKAAKQMSKRK